METKTVTPPPDFALPEFIQKDLAQVIEILKNHKVERIILYGSFARGDYATGSDLDLGVEGIPAEEYFRAWADVLMSAQRRISLLDLDRVHGYLRERILSEGRVVYAI